LDLAFNRTPGLNTVKHSTLQNCGKMLHLGETIPAGATHCARNCARSTSETRSGRPNSCDETLAMRDDALISADGKLVSRAWTRISGNDAFSSGDGELVSGTQARISRDDAFISADGKLLSHADAPAIATCPRIIAAQEPAIVAKRKKKDGSRRARHWTSRAS
jgi:hypothetical protein